MIIRTPKSYDLKETSVTKEDIYFNRRKFLKSSLAAAAGGFLGFCPSKNLQAEVQQLSYKTTKWGKTLKPSSFEAITSYNNFYEFGTDKSDPKKNSHLLKPKPWTIEVAGHVEKTGVFDFDELVEKKTLEERIYRMRCVEAWSMVIPWIGVPLNKIIKKLNPSSKAKFVGFTTLKDPTQMPMQNTNILDWPYVEGLRIDEAMNPLTLLAVGLYGKTMPNQNGAPIRLVVPWKYGFKGIKSIVKIEFLSHKPPSSWNIQAPQEYGFYSNVNPNRDHPRWSQKKERRITGQSGFAALFDDKIDTLLFNGYAEEVAHLYKDMDLIKFF